MSEYKTLTNAQIFYTQNLLELRSERSNTTRYENSLEAAIWLSLHQSLICWLNELATYLNLPTSNIESLDQLCSPENCMFPDVQRLINLKQDPHSWLARLLEMTGLPGSVARHIQANTQLGEDATRQNNLIATDVSNQESEFSVVLSEFKEYVQNVRSQHVEW